MLVLTVWMTRGSDTSERTSVLPVSRPKELQNQIIFPSEPLSKLLLARLSHVKDLPGEIGSDMHSLDDASSFISIFMRCLFQIILVQPIIHNFDSRYNPPIPSVIVCVSNQNPKLPTCYIGYKEQKVILQHNPMHVYLHNGALFSYKSGYDYIASDSYPPILSKICLNIMLSYVFPNLCFLKALINSNYHTCCL